jgi:hypothetical protein
MANVTIRVERDDASELLRALAIAKVRALAAAEIAGTSHDEDGRIDCCEEAAVLGRLHDQVEVALGNV